MPAAGDDRVPAAPSAPSRDPEASQAKRRKTGKGPSVPRKGGLPCKQENQAEHVEEEGTSQKTMSVIARIIEHHKCPITQQLLVDPVIAEDGHIYERKALELWLMTKKTSPTTNKPMGTSVLPALTARQTVSELVEQGILDSETSLQFFSDRGRIRATRTSLPGPDLDGARKDFQRALALSKTSGQRQVLEFQLGAVGWMHSGSQLFNRAQRLQGEAKETAAAQDLRGWMLDLGEATRLAITWPLLEARRMTEWQDLPKSSRVKVLDDACELQRLCERPPPDGEAKVGWNAEMIGFAGKICTVQRVGDASHKNYILRRESGPPGRDFSFPYDALFLLAP